MADVAANSTTTANFGVGENSFQYGGRFDVAGDVDWIRINLTAGVIYRFYGSAQTDADPDAGDILMYLRRPDGGMLISDGESGVGLNAYFEYTPATSGFYYVAVAEYEEVVGSYDVTVLSFSAAGAAASANQFLTSLGNSNVSSGSDAVRIAGQGNDYQNNYFRILGEQGNDSLWGDARVNVISGGLGDDVVFGRDGADEIWGGLGHDTLNGDGGDDQILADAGDDEVNGGIGDDYLSGDDGEDVLRGGDGYDTLIGGADDDRLDGGADDDQLFGANGDDFLIPGTGSDNIDGGAGVDLVYYADSPAGLGIDLVAGLAGHAQGKIDTLVGIEQVWGSGHADTIRGSAVANRLLGQGGDDTLEGRAGADELIGGAGIDTAAYTESAIGVAVDLLHGVGSTGDAQGDTLSGIENLIGSAEDDRLYGDDGVNILTGGAGNDLFDGRGGADIINGGTGSFDTVTYETRAAAIIVDLADGTASDGDRLINISSVIGTSFEDRLSGDAGDNLLYGGDAADVLEGRAGADRLTGGNGLDLALYLSSDAAVIIDIAAATASGGHAEGDALIGIEAAIGSVFNDILTAGNGFSMVNGYSGNDLLYASENGGGDFFGGEGNDTIDFAQAWQPVAVDLAGSNTNRLDRVYEVENVVGSAFGDGIYGDAASNRLDGAGGSDVLQGRGGADLLIGGVGLDWASYSESSAAVVVDVRNGLGTGGDAAGDRLTAVEYLTGSAYDDQLSGDDGVNRLEGGDGNDVLRGRGGRDLLQGGAGIDTASYTDADSALIVDLRSGRARGADTDDDALDSIEIVHGGKYFDNLSGTDADDTLRGFKGDDVLRGRGGADLLEGGDGIDIASYADSAVRVRVDLETGVGMDGDAQGDRLTSIETVHGSAGNDVLSGGAGAETLRGFDGDDVLRGRGGADLLEGGAGIDTVSYTDAGSGVRVDLTTGTGAGGDAEGDRFTGIEIVHGSRHGDVLTGSARAETLRGFEGDDVLRGRGGADLLEGGDGVDTVTYTDSAIAVRVDLASGRGFDGDAQGDQLTAIETVHGSNAGGDLLLGAAGSDTLRGYAGDDRLVGREGADLLEGGTGADTFIYRAIADSAAIPGERDTINDFSRAQGDRIDLSMIDADPAHAGDQAFRFMNDMVFDGVAGAVVVASINAQMSLLRLDIDGDRIADMEIMVRGIGAGAAADFVL